MISMDIPLFEYVELGQTPKCPHHVHNGQYGSGRSGSHLFVVLDQILEVNVEQDYTQRRYRKQKMHMPDATGPAYGLPLVRNEVLCVDCSKREEGAQVRDEYHSWMFGPSGQPRLWCAARHAEKLKREHRAQQKVYFRSS